jgi:hypothetical protein
MATGGAYRWQPSYVISHRHANSQCIEQRRVRNEIHKRASEDLGKRLGTEHISKLHLVPSECVHSLIAATSDLGFIMQPLYTYEGSLKGRKAQSVKGQAHDRT